MIHRTIFIGALLAALAVALPGRAGELIMFEREGCAYCATFNRDIAPILPRTELGQRAPLRRVDIRRPIPSDLGFVTVERITPVFVVVDQGREIGRIRGYPGEDHFWGLLTGLIGQIPERTARQPGAALAAN